MQIGELVKEELNSGLKKALNSTEGSSDWDLMQEHVTEHVYRKRGENVFGHL